MSKRQQLQVPRDQSRVAKPLQHLQSQSAPFQGTSPQQGKSLGKSKPQGAVPLQPGQSPQQALLKHNQQPGQVPLQDTPDPLSSVPSPLPPWQPQSKAQDLKDISRLKQGLSQSDPQAMAETMLRQLVGAPYPMPQSASQPSQSAQQPQQQDQQPVSPEPPKPQEDSQQPSAPPSTSQPLPA